MKIRPVDIVIDAICIVMILGVIGFVAVRWGNLPDRVPTNYNFNGEVTGYSSKATLIILPVIAVISFVMITVIEFFPKSWNTGVKVTARNRESVYRIVKNCLVSTKLIITILFSYLTVMMCSGNPLPGWFTPVTLIAVILVPGFWLVQLLRYR